MDNFNIGGLVFEVTSQKEIADKNELPTAWIEIVISQLNMKELITDEVLAQVNEQISIIKDRSKKQAIVFEILKQEVLAINFPELFKDANMLKKIYKIMTAEDLQ